MANFEVFVSMLGFEVFLKCAINTKIKTCLQHHIRAEVVGSFVDPFQMIFKLFFSILLKLGIHVFNIVQWNCFNFFVST